MTNEETKKTQNNYEELIHKESILVGAKIVKEAKEIYGIPTGIEGLDDLFYTIKVDEETGEVKKVSLKGIPAYSVFNLTGTNDTGKTIFAEQFTITQAKRGQKVAYITVESPANFVISSLKYRSYAMGYKFEEIEDNIILIDAASNSAIRENIPELLATLAYAIKTYNIKFTVIDSITGLFESKEVMARTIVRKLFNFMKKWYQTAIFISQKRNSHEDLTAEAAGGYAVGHIVDGSIVLAKELISSQYMARTYKKKLGEVVRLFRIDGCRLSGHDTRTHFMEITDTGLIRILKPISEEL